MEKSIIDLSPYLRDGEKILFKAHAEKSKSIYLEIALCALFWFLGVAGDCFVIGYANAIKTAGFADLSWFLPVFVILVALHLVPLGTWVISISSKATANSEKWFVLTDKRVICISGAGYMTTSSVYLTDVLSVKASKKYVLIGLSQGRSFKVSEIGEKIEGFSAALERVLDELFAGNVDYGENLPDEQNLSDGDANLEVVAENSDENSDNLSYSVENENVDENSENIENSENTENSENAENSENTEKNTDENSGNSGDNAENVEQN